MKPSKVNTGNDLSSIRGNNILTDMDTKLSKPQKKQGRPTKGADKATKLVGVKFTEEEYQKLQERADLIPLATLIKNHLLKETDWFD